MKITSTGIKDGMIADCYGSRGTQFNKGEMPTYSLPMRIEDAPTDAVSFALVLEDKDAYPVSGGFVWIHWTAANITKLALAENESQTATDFVQGVNSWISIQGGSQPKKACCYYGGMCPPDAPHLYELHVYALNTMLDVEQGFMMNQLYHQMEGHILEEAVLKATYSNN